jgi:hypothetical protein
MGSQRWRVRPGTAFLLNGTRTWSAEPQLVWVGPLAFAAVPPNVYLSAMRRNRERPNVVFYGAFNPPPAAKAAMR